jgi:hypothetical protein
MFKSFFQVAITQEILKLSIQQRPCIRVRAGRFWRDARKIKLNPLSVSPLDVLLPIPGGYDPARHRLTALQTMSGMRPDSA